MSTNTDFVTSTAVTAAIESVGGQWFSAEVRPGDLPGVLRLLPDGTLWLAVATTGAASEPAAVVVIADALPRSLRPTRCGYREAVRLARLWLAYRRRHSVSTCPAWRGLLDAPAVNASADADANPAPPAGESPGPCKEAPSRRVTNEQPQNTTHPPCYKV